MLATPGSSISCCLTAAIHEAPQVMPWTEKVIDSLPITEGLFKVTEFWDVASQPIAPPMATANAAERNMPGKGLMKSPKQNTNLTSIVGKGQ